MRRERVREGGNVVRCDTYGTSRFQLFLYN